MGIRLFRVQERERQRLILFINAQGRPRASSPETGLQSVWFPLLSSQRQSGFRLLWLRLKRLLIAWLIHSTCEGQSETPGRGGVPCENLWGSTAHPTPWLCLLPRTWRSTLKWSTLKSSALTSVVHSLADKCCLKWSTYLNHLAEVTDANLLTTLAKLNLPK